MLLYKGSSSTPMRRLGLWASGGIEQASLEAWIIESERNEAVANIHDSAEYDAFSSCMMMDLAGSASYYRSFSHSFDRIINHWNDLRRWMQPLSCFFLMLVELAAVLLHNSRIYY